MWKERNGLTLRADFFFSFWFYFMSLWWTRLWDQVSGKQINIFYFRHFFPTLEYVYYLYEMSNLISDVNSFIINLMWGFKKNPNYSHNFYLKSILAYFGTYCLDPTPVSLPLLFAWYTIITAHSHLARHTHAHHKWLHSLSEKCCYTVGHH